MLPLDLDLLLQAYANGIFPMSDARDDPDTFWIEPEYRAIMPLDGFRLSKSLAKAIRQDRFVVTADTAFRQVIATCAESQADRRDTWINPDIEDAFGRLHDLGRAHSIECWSGDRLVGGLYGLELGRAFFGESMFSRETNASKVALAWLVARLKLGGFLLLDCQFMTDHLASLGAIEITQGSYLNLLENALTKAVQASSGLASSGVGTAGAGADWGALDGALLAGVADGEVSEDFSSTGASSPGKLILQALTQTS
ncbi:leucyl/phenylalanyl-tRNA--protein transferase [Sphingorhabdus sp.]|uniref:leucyl/phenylalanyl-tRNA--protein transferase n=1 Tax=Sphingorhabdus sp. TaxID=1902408 RepID=UPI0039199F82